MAEPLIHKNNLGADFAIDNTNSKIYNLSILTGSVAPVSAPVVIYKSWLWVNTVSNQVTHYWNGSSWIALDFSGNNLVRSAISLTLNSTHYTVVMTTASTVVTLPTPVANKIYKVKNLSSGSISVTGHLDDIASQTQTIPTRESISFQSDGATWFII